MRRPEIPCTPESIAKAKAENTRQRAEFAHHLIEHGDVTLARKLDLPLDDHSQQIADLDLLTEIVSRQGVARVYAWVRSIRDLGIEEVYELNRVATRAYVLSAAGCRPRP